MKEFIVVVFEDESHANAGLIALRELAASGSIELHSVGVAAKDTAGDLSIKDAVGKGAPNALTGAAVGGLIGLLGGPVGALAGAAGGAWIGSWRDMTRLGMGAEFLEQVASALSPGKAAVIAEIEAPAGLDDQMRALGGRVFREPSKEVAAEQAQIDRERAAAAARGETLPEDEARPQLVKGRPTKSAHP